MSQVSSMESKLQKSYLHNEMLPSLLGCCPMLSKVRVQSCQKIVHILGLGSYFLTHLHVLKCFIWFIDSGENGAKIITANWQVSALSTNLLQRKSQWSAACKRKLLYTSKRQPWGFICKIHLNWQTDRHIHSIDQQAERLFCILCWVPDA